MHSVFLVKSDVTASEKRGASGTGAARRGGGDDDRGREARRRFGGKRQSDDLEGDEAFVTGRIRNRDKRPFTLGLQYDPRLKTPLCHGWPHNP
jgi:hypothetical protein